MARGYDPYATLEQPAAAPAGPARLGNFQDRIRHALAGGARGPLYPGAPGRGNTDIENDPNKFFQSRLGDRFSSLFSPDPGIFESIRERATRESGARGRAAQLALQSRGGDIPGAYGVTSVLSGLGEQSDLSRELGAANLSEQERARSYQEQYANRIQDFLQQLYADYLGNAALSEREKAARKDQGRQAGSGGSIGIGPVKVGFAEGGIVTRLTHALLGEHGPETIIPGILSGIDLARARAAAVGHPTGYGSDIGLGGSVPSAAHDGDASTLPLPPAPYGEPAAYQPQGALERIGALSRLIHLELGPHAPGVLKALALGAGGLAAVGEHRLKAREEQRGQASDYVKKLNEGQTERYKKQLEVAGRAPIEMVQLPDGTWVKKYSAPGTAAIIAKNPTLRPPKATPAPKPNVEVGRYVNDVVGRIDAAKSEGELAAILNEDPGVQLSKEQAARVTAAHKAAVARLKAKAEAAY